MAAGTGSPAYGHPKEQPSLTDLAPTPDARSASGDGAAIDMPSTGPLDAVGHDPGIPAPAETDPKSPDRRTLALEAGRVGIWEWDLSTNTVWWSHRIHEITGVPPDLFPGTLDGFAELVHPQDRAMMRQALDSALHGHLIIQSIGPS
jgi:PAS domain-containing protein